MHRFKRIGLVIDLGSHSIDAIQSASELAQKNNGCIFVIVATQDPLNKDYQSQIEEKLTASIKVSHSIVFLTGVPIHRISAYVKANSIDIIVTEPDHTTGLKRFFYGSLTMSMLRKTPCPIWIVKPDTLNNVYKKVLICVDPISDNEDKLRLNQKLIEVGTSFAKRSMAECHLLTAWYYYGESSINGPFINMPEKEVKKLITGYKTKIAHAFEKLQKLNTDILKDSKTHLIHGQPQKIIPEFVVANNIDIVIMGTVARTGLQGFIIGNTAESIINQLDCSLLAIKPDNFESPFD